MKKQLNKNPDRKVMQRVNVIRDFPWLWAILNPWSPADPLDLAVVNAETDLGLAAVLTQPSTWNVDVWIRCGGDGSEFDYASIEKVKRPEGDHGSWPQAMINLANGREIGNIVLRVNSWGSTPGISDMMVCRSKKKGSLNQFLISFLTCGDMSP